MLSLKLDLTLLQVLLQTLAETRFDSMQRLIAFLVLFHSMGKAVADFWPTWTLGLFSYNMSRTQSIMRVATTASPVSGQEVTLGIGKASDAQIQMTAPPVSGQEEVWQPATVAFTLTLNLIYTP